MADIVEILQKAGASTFADLTSLVSARAVRSALAAGRIRRLAKGVYALPEQADPMTVARAHGGVLSHQSAAIAWGFQVLTRPLAPHVTIHRNLHLRNVKLPCVLHRQDVPELDGLTTPLRTVLDCARSLPFGEALTVADSALRLGAISTSELLAAADQASGNGCRQIRRVAEFADSRAESALESMLRSRVLDAGFHWLRAADGHRGRRLFRAGRPCRADAPNRCRGGQLCSSRVARGAGARLPEVYQSRDPWLDPSPLLVGRRHP